MLLGTKKNGKGMEEFESYTHVYSGHATVYAVYISITQSQKSIPVAIAKNRCDMKGWNT